ncbi:MAG: GNAT family N-acetyltransferase [Actinomycetota bacterium]
MNELRTDLTLQHYVDLLEHMRAGGYRLFALDDDGELQALAGIAIRTNFYYRKYLFVYDLITTGSGRSKGHGRELLLYLEDLGRSEGCNTLALTSGLQRADAHRFYEDKMGYRRVSYAFTKVL